MEESAYSLACRFQDLQEERAHVYRIFEEGHKIYLQSGPGYDFSRFRSLVSDITNDFKRISQDIITIECKLRKDFNLTKLANFIATVQDHEKRHLELLARLQLAIQDMQDNPSTDSQPENHVQSLKNDLAKVRMDINDDLEEIRYIVSELL